MHAWRPSGILRALLIWSAVTFILFWLPAVRGIMDGPTYEWAHLFGFSGAGVSGDYWFLVLGSALAIGFLALGYCGARLPFPALLLGWHGLLAAGAIWASLSFPQSFRFRGDTLGVEFSLAWAGPVLFGGFFLLALYWVIWQRPREHGEVPPWGSRNRVFAWAIVGVVPLQFGLLRFGEPHGTTDQIGVLLTLAQWALVSAALYPWPTRSIAQTPATSVSAAGAAAT